MRDEIPESESFNYAMLVLQRQLDLIPHESWVEAVDFDVITPDERTLLIATMMQAMNALLNQSLLLRILEGKCRKVN